MAFLPLSVLVTTVQLLAVAFAPLHSPGPVSSPADPHSTAAARTRISITAPDEVEGGSRVVITGLAVGTPPGATVVIQGQGSDGWQQLARGPARRRRFRVAFTMPADGSGLTVRGMVQQGGRRLAVSPTKRIRALSAAPPPGPSADSAPTPSASASVEPPAPVQVPVPTPQEAPSPDDSYWGAWIGRQFTGAEPPWDMTAASSFEQVTGKGLSLINFSSPFATCSGSTCSYEPFPAQAMEGIRTHGAIPFFSWASDSVPVGLDEPDFQLADVIEGRDDNYIREFAAAAKAWGHPFFLRFNWEMNGDWFPWTERTNGNQPGEYVSAWRHVHDIFSEVGADNASWVWCPYVDPNATLQSLESLYPGDEYVDWTCLDGYNWGPSAEPPRHWRSFSYLFGPTYRQITESVAPTKPMLVGETASSEIGGSKPEWIGQMFEALAGEFPRIQGLMWFDKEESGMDWPIETSEASAEAFAAGIGNGRFLDNSFGALDQSPVPAP